MSLALLAPGAVSVQRKSEGPPQRHVALRAHRAKAPLRAPRAVADTSRPDVRPVETLFSGGRYLADPEMDAALPAVSAPADEEPIALEENEGDFVEDYVADSLFDSGIEHPVLTVDLTPIWDPRVFDVIPSSIIRDGYHLYDDFHGTGIIVGDVDAGGPPVIPEPEPGALLAVGLVALALRARRRD